MRIYNYHSTTKEYLSESKATPSPLEPENYLIPANSTTIKPPNAKDGEVVIFTGTEWNIEADFRGKVFYKKDDQAEYTVSKIGLVADDYTSIKPELELQNWDEASQSWRYDLETYKKAKYQSVLAYSDTIRVNLSSNASPVRLASWNEKAVRAHRVISGAATDGDRQQLQIEAGFRGKKETVEALATRQLALSDELAVSVAYVDGMEGQGIKGIEQSETIKQIDKVLAELKATAESALGNFTPYGQL